MLGYIGPGLGGGIIAVVIGVLLSVSLAILSFFWKPVLKVIRYFSPKKDDNSEPEKAESKSS